MISHAISPTSTMSEHDADSRKRSYSFLVLSLCSSCHFLMLSGQVQPQSAYNKIRVLWSSWRLAHFARRPNNHLCSLFWMLRRIGRLSSTRVANNSRPRHVGSFFASVVEVSLGHSSSSHLSCMVRFLCRGLGRTPRCYHPRHSTPQWPI